MQRILGFLLGGALVASAAAADSDVAEISAREVALAAAIEQADPDVVEALVTKDVRIVRAEGITFTVRGVTARLASLFGSSPEAKVSRSLETIQVSESREFAFVTGTQVVAHRDGAASSLRYLAIWRRIVEFEKEWRLAFDAPLEVWRSLDGSLSVDAVAHTPGLFVVNLAPSELAQEMEPAAFRQSKAQDLAYSVGEYYVPPTPDSPDAPLRWGHYLATWVNEGPGWRLLHASFPEPRGTSPD